MTDESRDMKSRSYRNSSGIAARYHRRQQRVFEREDAVAGSEVRRGRVEKIDERRSEDRRETK